MSIPEVAGIREFRPELRATSHSVKLVADWTIFIIFNVVIGGIGSFEGPIIGTMVYFVLRQYLSGLGPVHLILLGSFSIFTILVERRGLWGLVRRALGDDLLPIAHKPSPAFRANALPE